MEQVAEGFDERKDKSCHYIKECLFVRIWLGLGFAALRSRGGRESETTCVLNS